MGKGKALSDNCLMFSVIILNVICGIFGALIFALAMWMRLEGDVRDWVRDLGMTEYWTGLYILMAAGAIIMIIAFCGCCGAFSNNSCLLGTSAGLVILALILELAGAIFIIINGTESSELTPYLDRTFSKLLVDSNYNDRANRILQTIQEKVGCCGANNYQDYTRNNLPVSDYCRDHVSGNIYQEGCTQQLSIFIEKRAAWIAGIALFVGLLQIILVCVTVCYWRNMSDEEYNESEEKRYTEVPQRAY